MNDTNAEAREWAESFENKSESELAAMTIPPGLSMLRIIRWKKAKQAAETAAIRKREAQEREVQRAQNMAASATSSLTSDGAVVEPAPEGCEIALDADDVLEAEELTLAREEQAQRRGVIGRSSPFSDPAPMLDEIAPAFARPQARAVRNDGDTEHLLNGLIAECHLLMRAVTLPSAMRAGDADTRRQFLESAMRIAQVGAKVGRAVAKLRGAGASTEIRQRHISERVYSGPAPLLENGAKT